MLRRWLPMLLLLALLSLLLLAVGLEAQAPQPQESASRAAESLPTGTSPSVEAVQLGAYPAQLAGHTGAIQPSRYGPKRNDPAEGIPAHAYSPFDEARNREYPCPPGGCEFQPGVVLIKLAPQVARRDPGLAGALTTDESLNAAFRAHGVQRLEPVFPRARPPQPGETIASPLGERLPRPDLTRWQRAILAPDTNVYAVVEALAAEASVDYAEPDYLRKPVGEALWVEAQSQGTMPLALPGPGTDPLYSQQWHLDAANVPAVWQWLEDNGYSAGGSHDVIVAIIDTGVDYTHPDLAASMWVNAPEFGGTPGVDDDGNGYVDDIYGADTVYPDGDPQDDHGHGTHVAGIVAAQANNGAGGVGVAYNVQLMALKAAQYSGVLASSDIAEAIYYAVEKGADVINMSFGGYARSQVEEDALAVAFGQAVLVAAAGNDGRVNLPCLGGRDMYPGAYNWVLGVMASASDGTRGGFSNYDCVPHDAHEYELMAPGVDVWSTLPAGSYAAWDGTSMAAPIVSGIAALARTHWSDPDVYSSRFIMGQIAANAAGGTGGVADACAALIVPPNPELSYLEHWLFDTEAQSPGNDDDGIVDAGETVDLAIVIRNHWGKADPVTVTLEAWAEGAVYPDPYVEMITGTVSYGAIGSFNQDDNGLIYDEEGVITGVQHPFRFTVPITTPNDHVIPFRLTVTAGNGYDPDDPDAPYVFGDRFYLIVQRGVELPRIISQDMVLTKDYYWLVPDSTLIEEGVAVTITKGTQVQFWSGDPSDPYHGDPDPYLQVEGHLALSGTVTQPVELFPWPLFTNLPVELLYYGNGSVQLSYVRVLNPKIEADPDPVGVSLVVDHSHFEQDAIIFPPVVEADRIQHSRLTKLGSLNSGLWVFYSYSPSYNLYDSCYLDLRLHFGEFTGNVFLKNYKLVETQGEEPEYRTSGAQSGYQLYRPAFLRSIFPVQEGSSTYLAVSSQRWRSSGDGLRLSLDDADSFANHLGGHLVAVGDSAENSFLGDYSRQYLEAGAFQSNYPDMDCGDLDCWNLFRCDPITGLTDQESEGTFAWTSGEPLNYTHWAGGQPDGDGDYVYYDRESIPWWYDGTLDTCRPFILEIPGTWDQAQIDLARDAFMAEGAFNTFTHNAILNVWWDPDIDHWMQFWGTGSSYDDARNWTRYINSNYWGTLSSELIDLAIHDYQDDFNLGKVIYQPILTTAPETAYPFVVDVILSTESEPDASVVGAETVTFTVTFNRDMDMAIQPTVSFGPDVPMTDYTIHPVDGGWADARTWMGTFDVNPITGDGYQLIRVAGAVAADDAWLVTGDDAGRFRFEIITSGTEAMNLQATGGEGYVDLMWTQDDFDLLAGFNLYRATSAGGTYARLNDSIIPPEGRTYRDTDVQPGQPYYYKFTVVKSDMTESDPSNIATATPVDTIPPAISHTPVTQAPPGLPLTLSADVTDNVGVQGVTLYYRALGATSYLSRAMAHTTGDRYSATIEGSQVASPGLEYYLEASDGVSTVRDGRPEYPHQVIVEDRPVVTTVSPGQGPASGGTVVTLAGSNFKSGASVTFGGAVAGDVTLLSASQMTCTTPAHYPSTVDVTVENPDSQSGTLLRGFTYEADVASLSLPDTGGGQYAIVQVPVNAADLQGLAAADLTITFDPAVLSAQGAGTGNLTPGWSVVANTSTPGEVLISMASPGGTVTGSGILVLLEFEVLGAPGASTALLLTSATLNDGAILVDTADGSFQVNLVYDISGAVGFWNGGVGVANVLLLLAGDRIYTDLTDASGAYTVSGAQTDDYVLTPSRSDGANGISAYDASLVLQHAVGLITLSGHQATAADVNRSGAINSMDAFYILQKAVDLISLPFPGAGIVWDFDPGSRSYTNLSEDLTGQDFTAVLLGDVSGNWSEGGTWASGLPEDERLTATQNVTATLFLPEVTVQPGELVTVPLDVTLPQSGVEIELYSVDLILSYDPAVISVTQVLPGAAVPGWSLAYNDAEPGAVRVALAGALPTVSSGEFLRFVFTAGGSAGVETDLMLAFGELNEGAVPAELQAGHLSVVDTGRIYLPLILRGW